MAMAALWGHICHGAVVHGYGGRCQTPFHTQLPARIAQDDDSGFPQHTRLAHANNNLRCIKTSRVLSRT